MIHNVIIGSNAVNSSWAGGNDFMVKIGDDFYYVDSDKDDKEDPTEVKIKSLVRFIKLQDDIEN